MTCKQCGKREVEPERECYATPVCFTCLPPPRKLPVREWERRPGTQGQIVATNYCEYWHKPSGRRCGLRGGHQGEHWDGNSMGDAESAVSPPSPSPMGKR